ncbi:MAG: hypothetical protein IT559_04840 [Alphaproteobacteria bacterium]|nr:hypothetical protein [Alphaproteobacteria bacterium]
MEETNPAVYADDLPFSAAQTALEKSISKLAPGRAKNCCRNAFRRVRQAWLLRSIDPEMAVFSAMTGEEEAASAVIAALKAKGYVGADALNAWSHPHKVGVIHMAHAVGRLLHECGMDSIKFHIQPETPRIDAHITNLEKYGGPKDVSAILNEPLNWSVKLTEKIEDGERVSPVDFGSQLQDIASDRNIESFVQFIRQRANERNTVLYAAEDGIPQVKVQDGYFQSRLIDIATLVGLTIVILQADVPQSIAQQGLDAYIKALGKLVRRGVIDKQGGTIPDTGKM